MHLKHVAIVEEMKSAITNVTAEVAELGAALQSTTRGCPGGQVQTLHDASQAQRMNVEQSGSLWKTTNE